MKRVICKKLREILHNYIRYFARFLQNNCRYNRLGLKVYLKNPLEETSAECSHVSRIQIMFVTIMDSFEPKVLINCWTSRVANCRKITQSKAEKIITLLSIIVMTSKLNTKHWPEKANYHLSLIIWTSNDCRHLNLINSKSLRMKRRGTKK